MTEKYNISWDKFDSNASKSFGKFRNESYLHDVTLISDDYKQISAHKLVLSASSEYFKKIFQETKQSQPLLCLIGVQSVDLQNFLDYIYEGEVKVHEEDLERFLTIAQKIKLEGLVTDAEEEKKGNELKSPVLKSRTLAPTERQRKLLPLSNEKTKSKN